MINISLNLNNPKRLHSMLTIKKNSKSLFTYQTPNINWKSSLKFNISHSEKRVVKHYWCLKSPLKIILVEQFHVFDNFSSFIEKCDQIQHHTWIILSMKNVIQLFWITVILSINLYLLEGMNKPNNNKIINLIRPLNWNSLDKSPVTRFFIFNKTWKCNSK